MKNILVVDDSAFMRKVIADIIESDNELKVIDTARNGKEALEKLNKIEVDLVTLDIEMPIMNGIDTLKKIMIQNPKLPVIMLSTLTKEGAQLTLKALEIGAIDFITKPENIFKVNSESKSKEIIEKIKAIIGTSIISKPIVKAKNKLTHKKIGHKKSIVKNIIALGCSTGGPRALQQIIPQIDSNINSAIVIVQHMPKGFTKSLSERLDKISDISVKEAEDGEELKNGYCYIAPGGKHLSIVQKNDKFKIILDNGETINGHRPSVDKLMDSVHKLKNINKMGVILTGMGSDGAKALKKLSNSGSYNIGQNESTCVVYGMPKSAFEIGAIDIELPLNDIVNEINKKLEEYDGY